MHYNNCLLSQRETSKELGITKEARDKAAEEVRYNTYFEELTVDDK